MSIFSENQVRKSCQNARSNKRWEVRIKDEDKENDGYFITSLKYEIEY